MPSTYTVIYVNYFAIKLGGAGSDSSKTFIERQKNESNKKERNLLLFVSPGTESLMWIKMEVLQVIRTRVHC